MQLDIAERSGRAWSAQGRALSPVSPHESCASSRRRTTERYEGRSESWGTLGADRASFLPGHLARGPSGIHCPRRRFICRTDPLRVGRGSEQRPRLRKVEGTETLGETAIDGPEQFNGFHMKYLVAVALRQTQGGAQFPEPGPLLSSNVNSFAKHVGGRPGIP